MLYKLKSGRFMSIFNYSLFNRVNFVVVLFATVNLISTGDDIKSVFTISPLLTPLLSFTNMMLVTSHPCTSHIFRRSCFPFSSNLSDVTVT